MRKTLKKVERKNEFEMKVTEDGKTIRTNDKLIKMCKKENCLTVANFANVVDVHRCRCSTIDVASLLTLQTC